MIYAPNMLLIGAASRNVGKTTFACEIVRRFMDTPVSAAKVTAIQERDGLCPRGGKGCGVCTSLEGDYCITEETSVEGTKDTQRLLAAGAHQVLWLRVLKEQLEQGAQELLEKIGKNTPVICESNSLRTVVVPGLFLMLENPESPQRKQSATAVRHYADTIVHSDGQHFLFDFDRISLAASTWHLHQGIRIHET